MMRARTERTRTGFFVILGVALLAFSFGCASKNEPVPEAPEPTDSEFSDGVPDTTPPPPRNTSLSGSDLPVVYFDLDSTVIKSEFRDALQAGARMLRDSGASVVIEGHCDERGSEEYNMALGERRATAVRKYLYNLGVPMGQMAVVSYGEARPAVRGSSERAWSMNRRAEFRVR